MHIWRTMKHRIIDPGDASFVMCFKKMLSHSKIPVFQMAILQFDRPENKGDPNIRCLEFLEKEVDNYCISQQLKINLRGHRDAAAKLCKDGNLALPGVESGGGKGGGKRGGAGKGLGRQDSGCFICGNADH